ncbi:uncharacterized protein [Physcomitrium patens]|uniref:uncharacterized protein isoform X1 n=1 Tax=Physcomitrium patens TaxID=3218 RepID=UPI003CCD2392
MATPMRKTQNEIANIMISTALRSFRVVADLACVVRSRCGGSCMHNLAVSEQGWLSSVSPHHDSAALSSLVPDVATFRVAGRESPMVRLKLSLSRSFALALSLDPVH